MSVNVSVGTGTRPTIEWSPQCPAGYAALTANGVLVWAIGFTATDPARANTIVPPIRYGAVPPGIPVLFPNAPAILTVGQRYTLLLFAYRDDGTPMELAQQNFIP